MFRKCRKPLTRNTMAKIRLEEKRNVAYEIKEDVLRYVNGNRGLHLGQVARIKKAMVAGDYIPPIIVDKKTLKIIDGQHRYAAFLECLKTDIPVTITAILTEFENPLLAAIRYNNSQKKWEVRDYVKAYVSAGNEDYVRFSKFKDAHSDLSYSAAAQIITGLDKSRVNCGKLKCTETDVKKAEQVYKELVAMANAVNDSAILSRRVVLAWSKNREHILSKTKTLEAWLKLLAKDYKKPQMDNKLSYTMLYLSKVV